MGAGSLFFAACSSLGRYFMNSFVMILTRAEVMASWCLAGSGSSRYTMIASLTTLRTAGTLAFDFRAAGLIAGDVQDDIREHKDKETYPICITIYMNWITNRTILSIPFAYPGDTYFSVQMKKKSTDLNRIEVVLAELGMSHRELAAGVGLGEVTISRYCNNRRQPSLKILFNMANYMKVDVRRLIVPNRFAAADAQK
jgi:putative transcriptional regulator